MSNSTSSPHLRVLFLSLLLLIVSVASAEQATLRTATNHTPLPYLAVQSQGLERSLYSWSRLMVFRLTGRHRFQRLNPLTMVLSIIYEPEKWQTRPLFALRDPQLQELFGKTGEESPLVSAQEVLNPDQLQRLRELVRRVPGREPEISLLIERAWLLSHLPSQLLIIPAEEPDASWHSPFDPDNLPAAQRQRIIGLHSALAQAIRSGDREAIQASGQALAEYLWTLPGYPARWRLQLDYVYSAYGPFRLAYLGYLLAALGFLLYWKQRWRRARAAGFALLSAALLLHTAGIILRYLISQRPPLSQLYESIVLASWVLGVLSLVFEVRQRSGMIGALGSGASFVVMVVVSLMPPTAREPQPLVAVLNSSWLTYHVLAMMFAYGAFILSFILSLGYLVLDMKPKPVAEGLNVTMEQYVYRAIQFGWVLLAIGIVTGALWAEVAWGRAWSWDPKETWSLITWLVYTIYLHLRVRWSWRGRTNAIAAIVGFACVLMTWFGVSYLPLFAKSLHSYI